MTLGMTPLRPGNTIAFASDRNDPMYIYTVRSGGTEVNRSTVTDEIETNPAWKSTGFQLVFKTDRNANEDIFRMNSHCSFQTDLTKNGPEDFRPDWAH